MTAGVGIGAGSGRSPGGSGPSYRMVLRRLEPGSIFRFSLLLYASMWVVVLVAGAVLWVAASVAGLRANLEGLVADLFASDTFGFKGGQMLRAASLGGVVLVFLGAGANVVGAVLYNLVSDLVGGLVVVFDQDGAAPAPEAKARRLKRAKAPPAGRRPGAGNGDGSAPTAKAESLSRAARR